MYSEINYSKAEHIATLTISTKDGRNSIGPTLRDEIRDAVSDCQFDADVRVLILAGDGDNFCIEDYPDGDGPSVTSDDLFGLLSVDVTDSLLELDKPIVASINGPATGGGCDIALSCDMRVAADTATICLSQITAGRVPGASTYYLPRVVRFGQACEAIFTGDPVNAKKAERIGLFDYVVPKSELVDKTRSVAADIAKGPPVAMRLTKRAMYRGLGLNSDEAKEYTALARSLGMRVTEESREGFNSFTERRPPNF